MRKQKEELFEEDVWELGTTIEFTDEGDLSMMRRWELLNHEEAILVGYM